MTYTSSVGDQLGNVCAFGGCKLLGNLEVFRKTNWITLLSKYQTQIQGHVSFFEMNLSEHMDVSENSGT